MIPQYHPLLLLDFYKVTHHDQYNKDVQYLVSYFTPRMSRIKGQNSLVMFGLQAFIKTYLQDYFQREFFDKDLDDVLNEYSRVLDHTLGKGSYNLEKIAALHTLGYLPLEIKAVLEGTKVPVRVPMIEIKNTHPEFAWLVNTIESLMSAELWHPMVSAQVGVMYRDIVNHYYDLTVDSEIPRSRALGDFSFRGQECLQSAVASSAAFSLSFLNSATVPAVQWLEQLYACDVAKEPVIFGSISTEHSVMCSNYSLDGDEVTFIRKLLTETYKDKSFSMVSDSYDYWNVVDNILPSLKKEIMEHDGCLFVRGDSGDPVEIVTETVRRLWKSFGGTTNKKGYKVLDPHIRAIYGDSITLQRCKKIYDILAHEGFACNNVSLGVGSFSMQCIEDENGELNPFTRDTFGIAVKATYGETSTNKFFIFKNPKTDSGNFKKSQKGICRVYKDQNGVIQYEDELYPNDLHNKENLLEPVFYNGALVREQSLSDIRDILWDGEF